MCQGEKNNKKNNNLNIVCSNTLLPLGTVATKNDNKKQQQQQITPKSAPSGWWEMAFEQLPYSFVNNQRSARSGFRQSLQVEATDTFWATSAGERLEWYFF